MSEYREGFMPGPPRDRANIEGGDRVFEISRVDMTVNKY
jgi:hypothetical protein